MELPYKGENIYINTHLVYLGINDQIMFLLLNRQAYLYEKLNGWML